MTSIGLNTGLKALLTAQSSLDTIGHNISNANTPGYSRQRLEVSAAAALKIRGVSIGGGVNADVVTRTTNALLQVRMTGQISSLSKLEAAIGGMTEVEALLGEPGSFGLGSGMSAFFGAAAELSTSTEDLVLRTGMVQKATALTTQFNQLSRTMNSLRFDTANQVGIHTKQVNSLSAQIVTLNLEIAETEATGIPANDLRDEREVKIRDLSSYVDIEFHEDSNGVVRVTAGGRLLVGGTRSFEMSAITHEDGAVEVFLEGSSVPLTLKHGKVAGLARVGEEFIPDLQSDFDLLARNMIFEMNRVHSTGTPSAGSFQTLTSSYSVTDRDLDGLVTDELIASAGLPFDVQNGELFVNVTRLETGEIQNHEIPIDQRATTVGGFLDALNAIPGVNANLNSFGRVQVFADAGFGFDFAPKLDPQPDKFGTMGSGHASLGAGTQEPYSLADGDTLTLTGPVNSFSVTFDSADFVEISEASGDELVAVLNSNADMQANGLRAVVAGDRLYIQTAATGVSSSFDITGGTSVSAFSWAAGTTITGADTSVDVVVGGEYSGDVNGFFLFQPKSDGTIGTTPGLEIDVFSSSGQLIATLDVGESYQPGTEIEVDAGITVKFGFGQLSASDNDSFRTELISDSDTSDVLAALGLNALFTGTGALDIAVRKDLVTDPLLIAGGQSGASGDNRAMLDMMALQSTGLGGLGGDTLGDFYGDIISDVGFDISTASTTRDVEEFLLQNLEERREQASGVNVDEEMVNMIRFEQAFSAASRYIQVLNELSADILSLI